MALPRVGKFVSTSFVGRQLTQVNSHQHQLRHLQRRLGFLRCRRPYSSNQSVSDQTTGSDGKSSSNGGWKTAWVILGGMILGAATNSAVHKGATTRTATDAPPGSFLHCITKLRREEQKGIFLADSEKPIRFHSVRVPSNSPVEDEFVYSEAAGTQGKTWAYWGVFDGHVGGTTSKLLKDVLVLHVSHDLAKLSEDVSNDGIVSSIKQSFLDLDNYITRTGLAHLHSGFPPESVIVKNALAPAYAGSCALLALFDPSTSKLRVACVGDSRAVLGRCAKTTSNEAQYTVIPLSIDQTGFNPDEAAKQARDHPGEDGIISKRSGRILGMAISRAFGDTRWKWDEKDSELAREKFNGPRILSLGPKGTVKTPPYLTGEPVITETTVVLDSENADFVIMATDGFWDHISPEDAVTCVSRWFTEVGGKRPRITSSDDKRLVMDNTENPDDPVFPIGKDDYGDWQVTPKDFVYEETNVATHLVQNALGGKRRKLFCGAVGTEGPTSRNARDDTTVQVIFFGKVHGRDIEL